MGLFSKGQGRKPVENDVVAKSITPDTSDFPEFDVSGFGQADAEPDVEPSTVDPLNLKAIENVLDGIGERPAAQEKAVNIWDLDAAEDAAPSAPPATEPADAIAFRPPAAASTARTARQNRNRTRLIGFDTSEGEVQDLFDEKESQAKSEAVQFPVGFALVVQGPGRGHSFPLHPGMALIGRGEDQSVRLDFGDTAISRNNHAAIVYDPDSKSFLLGQGGKSNIVRLNGRPVISNEELSDGDEIRLGETTLRLKALIGPGFDWDEPDMAANG